MSKAKYVIVVSGSRDFYDFSLMVKVLNKVLKVRKIDTNLCEVVIREGGAKGADRLARNYCHANFFTLDEVPADWYNINVEPCRVLEDKHGEKYNVFAGLNRNKSMIDRGDTNLVVLFQKSKSRGTANALNLAKRCRKSYIHIDIDTGKVVLAKRGVVTVNTDLSYFEE